MKKKLIIILSAVMIGGSASAKKGGYVVNPVPFTSVKVPGNSFWGERLEASRKITIPLAFSKCESEGRYKNFERAAHPSSSYDVTKLMPFSFDDTDPYKTIEGAAYILQTYPDRQLRAYIDSVIDIIAKAQEPDGYLYTARTQNPDKPHGWAGSKRWEKVEDLSHELYNLGHMIEGAVAHYRATGSRKFLDIAIRYADCVVRQVGPAEGQACVVPGHQIAEMALCKLYLVTGNRKYLEQAKFFLDYRGRTGRRNEYSQSHVPVVEQREAVGHAVRAAYMYAGMADVAALTGDTAYIHAIDRIWDNIVSKKLYITGGIGATADGEAFGPNYSLPNMSAYCETCAAIGNVYVNHRLFLLHGESKYYDVLERTLYNGLISGVSLDGGGFFYPNPLESMGQHRRQPWFGCACCPSNICRFIPSLPGYVYGVKGERLYVNLFLSNTATVDVGKRKFTLTQQTPYPFGDNIRLTIDKGRGAMDMKIRIPGWVRNRPVPSTLYAYTDGKRPTFRISVNGQPATGRLTDDGYYTIRRQWRKGDRVDIHFDMEARTVQANGYVEADRGMVCVERGPIVYCAEWPDNAFNLRNVLINHQPTFTTTTMPLTAFIPDSAGLQLDTPRGLTLTTLTTDAQTLAFDDQGRLRTENVRLKLIPYYAWAHRGNGNMKVWLPQELSAARPALPATTATKSSIRTSKKMPAVESINDRLVPKDADDRSVPYTHWWPETNGKEWIAYLFPEEQIVHSTTVHWFDDQPWGGCAVPDSWQILYRNADGAWCPVANPDAYPTEKGIPCTVNFDAVKTKAIKLEVKMKEKKSAGLFEWIVE